MCGWLFACMCVSCARVCVLQIEANKKAVVEEHKGKANKKTRALHFAVCIFITLSIYNSLFAIIFAFSQVTYLMSDILSAVPPPPPQRQRDSGSC